MCKICVRSPTRLLKTFKEGDFTEMNCEGDSKKTLTRPPVSRILGRDKARLHPRSPTAMKLAMYRTISRGKEERQRLLKSIEGDDEGDDIFSEERSENEG